MPMTTETGRYVPAIERVIFCNGCAWPMAVRRYGPGDAYFSYYCAGPGPQCCWRAGNEVTFVDRVVDRFSGG